jgi:hypothetical protein
MTALMRENGCQGKVVGISVPLKGLSENDQQIVFGGNGKSKLRAAGIAVNVPIFNPTDETNLLSRLQHAPQPCLGLCDRDWFQLPLRHWNILGVKELRRKQQTKIDNLSPALGFAKAMNPGV